MPESNLILALLADGSGLVSYRGSVSTLPNFRKAVYNVTLYVVTKDPNFSDINSNYTPIDATTYDGLRMGMWKSSPGTDANLLAITKDTDWTLTTDSGGVQCFQGTFQTLTDEMTAFVTDTEATVWLAINLYKGLNLYPLLDWDTAAEAEDGNATVRNVTDPGTSYSVVATQANPILSGTTTIKIGANYYAFTANPSDPTQLLLTQVI